MFAFHRATLRAHGPAVLKPVLVVTAAVLLSGCSSTKQPAGPQVFAWLQPQPPPAEPVVAAEADVEGFPDEPLPTNDGRAAGTNLALAGDEGYPVPKSPEEAGVAPQIRPTPRASPCYGWPCRR